MLVRQVGSVVVVLRLVRLDGGHELSVVGLGGEQARLGRRIRIRLSVLASVEIGM